MTVPDFWDHYYVARQRVADQRYWMLRASRHAQVAGNDARRNVEDALGYAISFHRRKSAWEVGDPAMRVIQIGCELCLPSAEKFREKNPGAVEWLKSQGCDEAGAVRRFREWIMEEGKHPFWRRGRQARKVVARKVTFRNAGDIHNHTGDGGASGAGAGDGAGSASESCPGGE